MKITRQTNISVVTERKFIVRQPAADEPINCERCREPMISAQTFADICGFSSRIIYRLIESDKIRFVETEANEIKVCPSCVNGFLESVRAAG